MTAVFCPGHITCFFHPVRTADAVTTGSRGAGIRISLGSEVTVEERYDDRVEIIIDGISSSAPVTRNVISQISPGRGFNIIVENDLPVGQGFGMSASGSIAAAMALCEMNGFPKDDAYNYAHIAEVVEGGGLGDVSAIMRPVHQPVRVKPGLPPYGEVVGTGIKFKNLTLAIIGGRLKTSSVIDNPSMQEKLIETGASAVDRYISDPSEEKLFTLSREFSKGVGLESEAVRTALDVLTKHGRAGMCMLGHSVFTTLSVDETENLLGDWATVYSCSSTDEAPVIRRA